MADSKESNGLEKEIAALYIGYETEGDKLKEKIELLKRK